jgi:hypothetical protein
LSLVFTVEQRALDDDAHAIEIDERWTSRGATFTIQPADAVRHRPEPAPFQRLRQEDGQHVLPNLEAAVRFLRGVLSGDDVFDELRRRLDDAAQRGPGAVGSAGEV